MVNQQFSPKTMVLQDGQCFDDNYNKTLMSLSLIPVYELFEKLISTIQQSDYRLWVRVVVGVECFFPLETGTDTTIRSLLCMVMSLDWESPTQTERIKLCNIIMNEESQYLQTPHVSQEKIYLFTKRCILSKRHTTSVNN